MSSNVQHAEEDHVVVPFRTYVNVWLALVLLTGVTVGAAYTDLKHLAIFTAILVACCKSMLVILYFMHIRFESRLFTWILVAIFATYAVFLILTFADYSFR
jgi:cytochrome c oxidase subunit 4